MKKLLLSIIVLILSILPIFSQENTENKNVLRVGVAFPGITLNAGYQYNFNKYIAAEAEVLISFYNAEKHYAYNIEKQSGYANTCLRGTLNAIYTPFPERFRWAKIGLGFLYECENIFETNSVDANASTDIYYSHSLNSIGINIPIRAYFIDNNKLVLFAFCDISLVNRLEKSTYRDFVGSNFGLSFGVKF